MGNGLETEEGWWGIRGHTSKLGLITGRHGLPERQEADVVRPRGLGSASRRTTTSCKDCGATDLGSLDLSLITHETGR